MKREIERWKNTGPQAISEGSRGQMFYFASDALADIAELHVETIRLAKEIEALKAIIIDYVDGDPDALVKEREQASVERDK